MTESPKRFNATFCALPTTIFERMSRLAAETGSINLGQGFPDRELEGPASLKNEVFRSMQEESNQYPPMMGVPALHEAIAAHSSRYCGISLDPRTQVLVTLGATEALAAAFLGLLNPGDEVLLFAPLYDSYVPMIRRAGGVPKILTLRPPSWDLPTFEEMEAAITRRTKLVVVNTPHNPTGKVLTVTELESIAALCRRHDLYAVLDEVYQHLVFPGGEHVTLASLDGMVDRCLRVGSAGKTFSFTDFKVGWACGPQDMITAIAKAHQFMTFTVNSALQRAVALGLNQEHDFYRGLGDVLHSKRQLLQRRLKAIGFEVLPAQGTYFLVADCKRLVKKNEDDVEFCYRLTREAKVTLIPLSAFYEQGDAAAPTSLVRFVTCKTDGKLNAACDALERYYEKTGR